MVDDGSPDDVGAIADAYAARDPRVRAVTDALPNVSGVRVADVLNGISDLVGRLAAALAATGSVTTPTPTDPGPWSPSVSC